MARSKASTLESSAEVKTASSSRQETKPQVGQQGLAPGKIPILQVAVIPNTPKVTSAFWEDENTLCYHVEVRGILVSRRADTNFINGTKLLNVAGLTRGKRDGLLKFVRGRQVLKIGGMNLKGVWIPLQCAVEFAKKDNIYDDLYPLLVEDISAFLIEHPDMFYISQNHKAPKARHKKEGSKSMSVLKFNQKKGNTNNQDASAQNVIPPNLVYASLGHPPSGPQYGSQIPPVNGYHGYPQPQPYPYYYQPFPPQPQGNGINGSIPQCRFPVAPITSSQLESSASPGNCTIYQIPQLRQGAQAYGYPPVYPFYDSYPYHQPSPNGNGQQSVPPPPIYPYNVSPHNYTSVTPQPKPPKAVEEQQIISIDVKNNIQSDIPKTQGDDKNIQNGNKNRDQKLEQEAQEVPSDDETKMVPKKRDRNLKKELEEAGKSKSPKKTRKK